MTSGNIVRRADARGARGEGGYRWEAKKRESRETPSPRLHRGTRGYLARAFIAGKKAAMERAAAAERDARESERIREQAAVTVQSMARLRRAPRDQRDLAPTQRECAEAARVGGGGGFAHGADAAGGGGTRCRWGLFGVNEGGGARRRRS